MCDCGCELQIKYDHILNGMQCERKLKEQTYIYVGC